MKKIISILFVIVIVLITLSGCAIEEVSSKKSRKKEDKIATLKVGEVWEVEGEWKFTIDSIERTVRRNNYRENIPADVFIITYSYENIGYFKSDSMFAGELSFYLENNIILDEKGERAYKYSLQVNEKLGWLDKGEKCEGTQICMAVKNKSNKLTVQIKQLDSDSNTREVIYELEIPES